MVTHDEINWMRKVLLLVMAGMTILIAIAMLVGYLIFPQ